MLVNLNDVLVPARKGKYAVGLFNTVNLELARGVMEAAEELDSPVIIGTAALWSLRGPGKPSDSHGREGVGSGGGAFGSRPEGGDVQAGSGTGIQLHYV